MKKTITLLSLIVCSYSIAQSSFNLYKGTSTNVPIPNGSTVSEITTADNQTLSSIKIKNMSAQTHTYNVLRTIVYQSPVLNTTSSSTVTPHTYFCFGNSCFDIATSTASSFDFVILRPAGSTSTVFPYADNTDDNLQLFKVYFEEGNSIGKYFIKYNVFEVNNPNDSATFTIKYNEFLGVNDLSNDVESVSDLYPNPTDSKAFININMKHDGDLKINISNCLGSVIYAGTQKCITGKNKLPIECSALNSGMYFVTIISGETRITKRLIVK